MSKIINSTTKPCSNRLEFDHSQIQQLFSQTNNEESMFSLFYEQLLKIAPFHSAAVLIPDSHQHYTVRFEAHEQISFADVWRENSQRLIHQIKEAWTLNAIQIDVHSFTLPDQNDPVNFYCALLPITRHDKEWGILALAWFPDNFQEPCTENDLGPLLQHVNSWLALLDTWQTQAKELEIQEILMEHTLAGIALIRDRKILKINRKFTEMLGYRHPSDLIGSPTIILYFSEQDYLSLGQQVYQNFPAKKEFHQKNIVLKRQDQQRIVVDISINILPDFDHLDEPVYILTAQDVTERQTLQEELMYVADHDKLTGLLNRRGLEISLEETLWHAKHSGSYLAVFLIDLDQFKPVNDTWGHEAGDIVLKEFASRIAAHLPDAGWTARLGGDEFVVVIPGLSSISWETEITTYLDSINETVKVPFLLPEGHQAMVGLSLGGAIYPLHGNDKDHLLRQADAAMYQIKTRRSFRSHWWQIGTNDSTEMIDVTVYYPIIDQFVDSFYDQLQHYKDAKILLNHLSIGDFNHLKEQQRKHLRFILDGPEEEEHRNRAKRLGIVHSLVGVNQAMLLEAMQLYQKLLIEFTYQLPLNETSRKQFILTLQSRLQLDLQVQMEAEEATVIDYLQPLIAPLPEREMPWINIMMNNMEALGALPGIQGAMLIRPNSDGILQVEYATGRCGNDLAILFENSHARIVIEQTSPTGQSLVTSTWISTQITSSPDYTLDPRYKAWHEPFRRLHIRSLLMVPILDERKTPVAIVGLYGFYPNQFEADWMISFAQGLQTRWQEIWARRESTQMSVLPMEQLQMVRTLFYAGKLDMHAQPIIDLKTGQVQEYELLARLQTDQNDWLTPDQFLPAFGEAEWERLFRWGLEQGLQALASWKEPNSKIAINLSPGLLLSQNLESWLQNLLQAYKINPFHLIIEVTEDRSISSLDQTAVLSKLSSMGFQLALDDLGAGYSSLLRLAMIPFDLIKLDQGLISRLSKEPMNTIRLLHSLIKLGHDFKRKVVIEGLENESMIETAAILGADGGQGFALARPMPLANINVWMQRWNPPFQNGEIHTLLGAIAFVYAHRCKETIDYSSCPLERFLKSHFQLSEQVNFWHQKLHDNNETTNDQIIQFFIENITP